MTESDPGKKIHRPKEGQNRHQRASMTPSEEGFLGNMDEFKKSINLPPKILEDVREFGDEEETHEAMSYVAMLGGPSEDEPDIVEPIVEESVGTSLIAIYLRDISRVPLLKPEEEVELAKSMERKQWALETLEEMAAERETAETVREKERLNQVIKEGDDARVRMHEANLRLVVHVARKYAGRGLALPDLIQEGSLGLSKGIDKFDYKRGFKVSTYVYWWIRQSVTRAIADQSRTIRLPVHAVESISRLYRASRELQQIIGREPTTDELAEVLEITEEKVRQIIDSSRFPMSLETPVGEADSILSDFIADEKAGSVDGIAAYNRLRNAIGEVFEELTERERRVLIMRFGLDNEDKRERTLGEIGEELGVSRERVRQIEAEALEKLRKPEIRQRLKGEQPD